MLFKLLRSPFSHSQRSRGIINHITFIHTALEVVVLLLSVHSLSYLLTCLLAPFTTHSATIAIISSFFLFFGFHENNNFSWVRSPFLFFFLLFVVLNFTQGRSFIPPCGLLTSSLHFSRSFLSNWRFPSEWIICKSITRYNLTELHTTIMICASFSFRLLCFPHFAICKTIRSFWCTTVLLLFDWCSCILCTAIVSSLNVLFLFRIMIG